MLHFTDIDRALRNMFEQRIAEKDDPWTIDELEVEGFESMGLVSLDGLITKMRIVGVHKIKLEHISLNLDTLQSEIDVVIPSLTVSGAEYDLRGRFGGLIPIFGKGPFTASVSSRWTRFPEGLW